MLQNIRENSSGWVAKLLLAAIIVVMAFFGFSDYLSPKIENYAAKVVLPGKFLGYGEKTIEISTDEFRRRFDQVRQAQRQRQGEAFDAAAFEKPENKRLILEQMIDEAAMQMGAQQAGVVISDAMVQEEILKIDAFKVNGTFDKTTYQLALQQQGYTPLQFQSLIRQDLLTRFIVGEYINSGIASKAEAEALLKLSQQTRDINYIELPVPALNTETTDAELTTWYNGHKSDYRTEETVAIEYVELDQSMVDTDLVVDDSVLRQRYQEQIAQYSSPEQRVASHILVSVDEGASSVTDSAAKAKAIDIAKKARANPNSFAELAKASDDIATKDVGGDLGPVEKGIFGDAFDAAFFALKPGQISDPVRMDDGWHVLYYRELIAGQVKPFEEVRNDIEATYLSSEKERRFNEIANKMVNAVSEGSTSLEPAAKAIGKPLLRTPAFTRRAGEGIAALDPVRKAAFSDDVLKERRVSELVEIEPNHVVLLRVTDHVPERTLPFADVKDIVRLAFVQDRASKAAEKQANALLQRFNKGESLQALATELARPIEPALGVGRQAPAAQFQPLVQEAFRLKKPEADKAGGGGIAKLPDGRFILMQLVKVNEPDFSGLDPAVLVNTAKNIGQIRGDQQAREYIKALRKRYQIKIAESRL